MHPPTRHVLEDSGSPPGPCAQQPLTYTPTRAHTTCTRPAHRCPFRRPHAQALLLSLMGLETFRNAACWHLLRGSEVSREPPKAQSRTHAAVPQQPERVTGCNRGLSILDMCSATRPGRSGAGAAPAWWPRTRFECLNCGKKWDVRHGRYLAPGAFFEGDPTFFVIYVL